MNTKELDWEYGFELIRAIHHLEKLLDDYKSEIMDLAALERREKFQSLSDVQIHQYDIQLKMALCYFDQLREDIFEHARKLHISQQRETENQSSIDDKTQESSKSLKEMLNQIKKQPEDKKK